MSFLKRTYKRLNDAISWLSIPRDDEGLKRLLFAIVLFVLFAPLFLLALIVVYNQFFVVVEFEIWQSILKFFELKVNTVEPSFGFAALLAAILSAPFVIWRTWVAHQDYKVKEQGHITDRINKAVEGLGAEKTVKQLAEDGTTKEFTEPNLEVRMGAIYALERIAKDSLRDHIQIMEILCAYIKENALSSPLPRTDVQVALNVIGRRDITYLKIEKLNGYRLDLRGANLRGATFEGSFNNAMFAGANLKRALLIKAELGEADFIGTNLKKACLALKKLKGIKFSNTKFMSAYLGLSAFQDVVFSDDVSGLTKDQIALTFGDASVTLPEEIVKPKHWPDFVLGNKFEAEYKKWLKDPINYIPPKS